MFKRRRSWSAIALGTLVVATVVTDLGVGFGRYQLAVIAGAVVIVPALAVAALSWPWVFPYGLYVALIPLENLLVIGANGTVTKLLGAFAGVVVAVLMLRQRRVSWPSPSVWLWFAFALWLVTSLLWTPELHRGLGATVQTLSILALYLVLSCAVLSERDLRTICGFIVLGGVVAALYGIYLFHNPTFASDPTGTGRLMIAVGGQRIDPNHLANSLILPLALSLAALLRARRLPDAVLHLLCFGSIGAGIVLTASREALIACALVLLTLVVLSKRRWLAAGIATLGMILAPIAFPLILLRFQEGLTEQGSARNYVWHVVWLSIQQHPLIGWGSGAGARAYDANYLAVSAPIVSYWDMSPHNTILYVMLELGAVGAVIWLCAYAFSLIQMNGIRWDDSLFDLRSALTAAFVGMSFVMLFIDLNSYKYFWLLLATIAQLHSVARAKSAASGRRAAGAVLPHRSAGGAVRGTVVAEGLAH